MPVPTKGDLVIDLPSRRLATILEHTILGDNHLYTLSDDVPLDPTGDGAFPTRGRNSAEICLPEHVVEALKGFDY